MNESLEYEMKSNVQSIISGKIPLYEQSELSPHDIIDHIKFLGGKEDEVGEDHINGWQADAWYYITLNGVKYCCQGSAYYGGVKLFKADEE